MTDEDATVPANPPMTPLGRLFTTSSGIGGWISIGIGIVAVVEGLRLGLGTLSRLGPGYIPMAVGVGLIGLGLVLLAVVLRQGEARASVPFGMPVILVLVSLAAFGVILPMFGFLPATMALMLIASVAMTGRIGVADIIYAVLISAASVAIFIYGLGMVLPVVKWPF